MSQIDNYYTFSIIVPSWKRPDYLKMCLDTLVAQDFPNSFEIIVVLRSSDQVSLEVARVAQQEISNTAGTLHIEFVESPGIVKAMKTGFKAAKNEIVGFCDDDAKYPQDWLRSLSSAFASPTVGGVGGPIKEGGKWQGEVGPEGISKVNFFGKITYGVRAMPNFQETVHVASLPGANMSFRRNLLSEDVFDEELDGPSYSPGNELIIGWSVRKQGFSLDYLPTCAVEHYSATWVESSRHEISGKATQYAHNLSYAHTRFAQPIRLVAYLLGTFLYGESISPGIIRIIFRKLLRRGKVQNGHAIIGAKWKGSRRGFRMRIQDSKRTKR
jgi:glycosyltransferase involved in cell wall biosynthesis